MKHRHRGFLAILGVAVAALLSTAIGLRGWMLHLPPPEFCSREELTRWLVLRDLAHEAPAIRLALVNRFETELTDRAPFAPAEIQLSEIHHQRLLANVALLKRTWFEDRVEAYHRQAATARRVYLERQLETLRVWSNIDALVQDTTKETETDADARQHRMTMEFFAEIDRWVSEAQAERRERMLLAIRDGVTCWLSVQSLDDEPAATCRTLAMRIVAELDAGLELNTISTDLTPPQREQLSANGQLLLQAWLAVEAEKFARLPAEDRAHYLDQILDNVDRWGLLDWFAESTGGSGEDRAASVLQIFQRLEAWIDAAPPDEQPQLRRLCGSLQQRIAWRQLRSLLPVNNAGLFPSTDDHPSRR
jgi:hypothetical protein